MQIDVEMWPVLLFVLCAFLFRSFQCCPVWCHLHRPPILVSVQRIIQTSSIALCPRPHRRPVSPCNVSTNVTTQRHATVLKIHTDRQHPFLKFLKTSKADKRTTYTPIDRDKIEAKPDVKHRRVESFKCPQGYAQKGLWYRCARRWARNKQHTHSARTARIL